MTCKHLNIRVSGKVQGVWFRKYTKDQADALKLFGTVQNMPDGSVYIEVESTDDALLDKFIKCLENGSPLSRVDHIETERRTECNNYKSFEIIR